LIELATPEFKRVGGFSMWFFVLFQVNSTPHHYYLTIGHFLPFGKS